MSSNRIPGLSQGTRIVTLLACAAPLFSLTVRGWTNALLLVTGVASFFLLLRQRDAVQPWPKRDVWMAKLLIVALVAPLLATAWSALLRESWVATDYDAPVRFWLAITVFLLLARQHVDANRVLRWTLPAGLLATLTQLQPQRWGALRPATAFTDPLIVGYVSLAFGLMCLVSISWRRGAREDAVGLLLKLAGVALGFYISIRSGSRTGWLAVPLVVALWLQLQLGWSRRWALVALPLAAFVPVLAAYAVSPTVQSRIDEAVQQAVGYNWSGVAAVNSIAERITFMRIAADVVVVHPLAGVGDTSRSPPMPVESFPYADPGVVVRAFATGLHNQVVSNTIRLGLVGGLATVLLLLVPLLVCFRKLSDPDASTRRNAAMGTAYFLTMGVSSLSTEIVDLKYAASLYALMVAVLCGSVMGRPRAAQVPTRAAVAGD